MYVHKQSKNIKNVNDNNVLKVMKELRFGSNICKNSQKEEFNMPNLKSTSCSSEIFEEFSKNKI